MLKRSGPGLINPPAAKSSGVSQKGCSLRDLLVTYRIVLPQPAAARSSQASAGNIG